MSAEHRWSPSIRECVRLFIDEQITRSRAVASVKNYRQKLAIVETWLTGQGITTIDELTPDSLKRYFQIRRESGLKPHTVATDARYIRCWLNYLIEIEVIDSSPMSKVRLPRLPKLQKPAYSVDEIKQFLAVATDREELVIMFLVDTGVRSTEFCKVTVGDIDLSAGTVRVRKGKGDKARTTFIGNATKKCLMRYWRKHGKPANNAPLIRSSQSTDGHLTRSGMLTLIKELGKRAGVDNCSVHRFRRTFAQWSLANDMDVRSLQLILGHSDIQTTVEYLGDNVVELKRKHERFGPIDHNL